MSWCSRPRSQREETGSIAGAHVTDSNGVTWVRWLAGWFLSVI